MELKKGALIGLFCFTAFGFTKWIFAYTAELPLEIVRAKKLPHPTPTVKITHQWIPQAQFIFYPGSLKQNIQRVAKDFGWPIVWKPENDYQWVGTARLASNSLPFILDKILRNFPLQAIFYSGNHILVITPRNIK